MQLAPNAHSHVREFELSAIPDGPAYLRWAPIDEIIDTARNGRMFILVDPDDPDAGGNLILAAQMATPMSVNFMARYGKGLICLAITQARASSLGLEPIDHSGDRRIDTAFTVSIEAREGVSTGISVFDRARTIVVAIDARNGAADIVTPGHVFPLIAQPGGVLSNPGQTEAATDLARLAGLNPSGVMCKIMNDFGDVASHHDLSEFARIHDLPIGSIRDLIEYRCRHDRQLSRVSIVPFASRFGGDWQMATFRDRDTADDTIALIKGDPSPSSASCVHMCPIDPITDIFGSVREQPTSLENVMRSVADAGSGIIILRPDHGTEPAQVIAEIEANFDPQSPRTRTLALLS